MLKLRNLDSVLPHTFNTLYFLRCVSIALFTEYEGVGETLQYSTVQDNNVTQRWPTLITIRI